MADATYVPATVTAPQLGYVDPVFRAVTVLLIAMMIPTLAAMALDTRTIEGVSIWMKPFKFEVALILYSGTLAIFARWMSERVRTGLAFRMFSVVVAICIFGEMAWIGGAAAYGTTSHFNVGTPLMAALYSLMGAFAVTLTSASLVMGIAIWRNSAAGIDPALRLSIALGLVLTFLLTVPVAGYMSNQTGHFVGTPVTGAAVPFMGWSREVGDLRVAHFFATHALHVLPLIGLLVLAVRPARREAIIWTSAIAFTAVTFALLFQAIAGQPVWPI